MRLLAMLVLAVVSIVVWYVRARRREAHHRQAEEATRAARKATLEEAACAVEAQAELSRSVAQRIEASPVEMPWSLRDAIGAVVVELDGVAAELRSCQVPVAERRTLIHR